MEVDGLVVFGIGCFTVVIFVVVSVVVSVSGRSVAGLEDGVVCPVKFGDAFAVVAIKLVAGL